MAPAAEIKDAEGPKEFAMTNQIKMRKSRQAFKLGYRGHWDRYHSDDEYRENCIQQGIPQQLLLVQEVRQDTDADVIVYEKVHQEKSWQRR